MSYKLKMEPKELGIVITFSGIIDAEEIDKIQQKINSDKLFPQMRYQIWDFSKAKEINVSIDQIQHFAMQAAVASGKNPKIRIAIIPRKSSPNTLGKTFHTFENVWGSCESKSFSNIDTAKKWGKSSQK